MEIKRLFSPKPALIVMGFFLMFNLGKMYPSTPCINPNDVQGGMSRLDSVLMPRQVKSQNIYDTGRVDSVFEQEKRVLQLNYNDNNIEIRDADSNNDKADPVEVFKDIPKQVPSVVKPPSATKKPEEKINTAKLSVPGNDGDAKNAPAANHAKDNNNALKNGPLNPEPKPQSNSHAFTDYYSTGSEAHHRGLKRLGYSSISRHSFKSPYIVDPHIYSRETIIKPPGHRKKKLIACFNCPQRFFVSIKHNNDFKSCPYSECELSKASGMNPNADMMLFWQDPESDHPPPRPRGQVWTFLTWEAPPNRAWPRPAKNWLDVFNYTMTYLSDADLYLPYDSLVWRDESLLHPDQYYIDAAKRKTKTAAWWVSHCQTRSKRRAFVDEMKKYIPDIDIYGACGDLSCPSSHNDDCWKSLNTTYKFYLAFENAFCPEYITEKFYKTFRYRYPVIPVVRGGFDYNKYFPKDILINAANFANAKDLAMHLIQLSKDPVKLGKMYKEKDRFGMLNRKLDWCDICEKIHTGGLKKQRIHDVVQHANKRPCWDAPNDIK